MDRRLTRFLSKRGASATDIEAAERDGTVTLLTVDRLLVPGEHHLDADEVARRSGMPPETAIMLWRALGFPDVPEGEAVFTDESVEVLRLLQSRADALLFAQTDADALVAQVRAVGSGLSRVAEAISDQLAEGILTARAEGLDDATIAADLIDTLDWPLLARLNDYALRVQLRAAVWRKVIGDQRLAGEIPRLGVGFVDLVGYTAISQELDGRELAALVARFESVTYDTVARLGARLVKTIGDEVMFVTEDPEILMNVALELTARTESDVGLPQARAGVALGPALAREGDYYGAVVNLAHRLVEIARPVSAVVSAEVANALEANPSFRFHRMRSRRIRGIGRVEIYSASRSSDPSEAPRTGPSAPPEGSEPSATG
ncbi:MAG: hypothetical protein JJE46_14800 [Acidimicrobiia bacterium]|nr:hypothetical protein [Acidimicrobiia bacterium]